MLYSEPILTEDWRTPNLHEGRGAEIKDWLKRHKVDKYAIVDDDTFAESDQHLRLHYVKTTFDDGLSYYNFCILRDLLSD